MKISFAQHCILKTQNYHIYTFLHLRKIYEKPRPCITSTNCIYFSGYLLYAELDSNFWTYFLPINPLFLFFYKNKWYNWESNITMMLTGKSSLSECLLNSWMNCYKECTEFFCGFFDCVCCLGIKCLSTWAHVRQK